MNRQARAKRDRPRNLLTSKYRLTIPPATTKLGRNRALHRTYMHDEAITFWAGMALRTMRVNQQLRADLDAVKAQRDDAHSWLLGDKR